MLANVKKQEEEKRGRGWEEVRVLFWRGLVPLLSFVSWRFGVLREARCAWGDSRKISSFPLISSILFTVLNR